MNSRPEARLSREVLLALGREPDVLLMLNPVGQGYYGALRPALEVALRPFGAAAMRAAVETMQRFRVRYGAGGEGAPDLLAVAGGVFVGLELKSGVGRVSPEQHTWHAAARARGARVEVIRSVDEARAAIDAARERR